MNTDQLPEKVEPVLNRDRARELAALLRLAPNPSAEMSEFIAALDEGGAELAEVGA